MLIIFAIIAVICSVGSCIYQDLSIRKITGEGMSKTSWLVQIAFHGAFTILSWALFNNPWVYVVMLCLIAFLSSMNREGVRRQFAWWFLIVLYALLLIFSVSHYADHHGGAYKGVYLWWWLLPILIAVIFNFGVSSLLEWLRAKKRSVINKLDSIAESKS